MKTWMKGKRILPAALALVALAIACGQSPDKKVVAEVEGRKITVGDMILQYRAMSPTVRPFVDTLEGKRGFLNDLINRQIMLIAADEQNLTHAPEIEAAAKRYEDGLLAQEYYIKEVREKVKVSDADVRHLYDMQGEEARLRLIVLPSQEKAAEVEKQLRGGGDFAQLARAQSMDASKNLGGDLGFHTWADYPPEVMQAAQPLKEGQLSGVFAFGPGYALVRLEGRRPVPQGSYEDEVDGLRRRMATMTEARLAREWTEKTEKEINFQVVPETVEFLLARMKDAQRGPQFRGQAPLEIPDADRTRPIATFTGHSWTLDDYLSRVAVVPVDRRPKMTATEPEVIAFIQNLAVREAAVDKAREMGLQNAPDIVDQVQKFREKQVVSYLHHEVALVGDISDDDMQKFYDENRASLIAPARANIRQAVFHTEEEAKQALSRVKRGDASMKTLAEEESVDIQSASQGGLVSVTRTAQPSAFEKAVFETEVNHIGGPIPMAHGGWIIFRVNGVEGESPMSYEDAKPVIRQKIAEERRIRRFDEWLAQQLEDRDIKINEDVLAEIEFGAPSSDEEETPQPTENADPLASS